MFKRILVPVDIAHRDEAKELLDAVAKFAAPWSPEIDVISVVPDVGMAIVGAYFDMKYERESLKRAEAELEKMVKAAGIAPRRIIVESGTVYDRVIATAEKLDADLIIVGAHSPELRDYLLGSNAARIVRHARQSVLVLRLHESPV